MLVAASARPAASRWGGCAPFLIHVIVVPVHHVLELLILVLLPLLLASLFHDVKDAKEDAGGRHCYYGRPVVHHLLRMRVGLGWFCFVLFWVNLVSLFCFVLLLLLFASLLHDVKDAKEDTGGGHCYYGRPVIHYLLHMYVGSVWFGLVWSGLGWFGLGWDGLVRFGLVWVKLVC